MLRGLLKLGLLAGAGWYAYTKARGGGGKGPVRTDDRFGSTDQPAGGGALTTRLTQLVNQAAAALRQRTTPGAATIPGTGAGGHRDSDGAATDGAPREARAAAMAAMPAVQPPEAFAAEVERAVAAGAAEARGR